MSKTAAEKILSIIERSREDLDFPTRVLDALRDLDGRTLNRRRHNSLVKSLRDRVERHVYDEKFGLVYSELTPPGKACVRFLLGHHSGARFDAEVFEKRNPAHFEGAREREAARDARTPEDVEALARKIDAFNEAQAALKADLEQYNRWPDCFDIAKEMIDA